MIIYCHLYIGWIRIMSKTLKPFFTLDMPANFIWLIHIPKMYTLNVVRSSFHISHVEVYSCSLLLRCMATLLLFQNDPLGKTMHSIQPTVYFWVLRPSQIHVKSNGKSRSENMNYNMKWNIMLESSNCWTLQGIMPLNFYIYIYIYIYI